MRLRSIAVLSISLAALCLPASATGLPINVIEGTDRNDRLVGTHGKDEIRGLGGHDVLIGKRGRDSAMGGAGDDVLYMGPAADSAHSGLGRNRVLGEEGNDYLWGEGKFDVLAGGPGDDWFKTKPKSSARISGGPGDDEAYTVFGRLRAHMGGGNDHVKLRPDNDVDHIDCGPGEQDEVHYRGEVDPKDHLTNCEVVSAEDQG